MKHPFTDIVVLVHNNLVVTRGFVKHLFKNTNNFHLIFVDNGSNEETAEYLRDGEKNGKWELLRSDTNLGIIRGRNFGATHVKADYFVNIDNDQYVGTRWLEILHTLMSDGYDIAGKEAWALIPPNSGGIVTMADGQYKRDYYPFRHCSVKSEKFTYIGCGGMLIKKKVYKKIGLFDDRFHPAFFEDPDLGFTAIRAGFKLGWAPNCPIEHLAHQTIAHQDLFQKQTQFLKSWRAFQKKWTPYFPKPNKMREP